jgi:hypothetical protein
MKSSDSTCDVIGYGARVSGLGLARVTRVTDGMFRNILECSRRLFMCTHGKKHGNMLGRVLEKYGRIIWIEPDFIWPWHSDWLTSVLCTCSRVQHGILRFSL